MPPCNRGYHTIYADPPWPEYGGGRIKRGADRHYKLMSIKEIIALKDMVQDLAADDCHLYLWTTNNYLPDALVVMREWGFNYKGMSMTGNGRRVIKCEICGGEADRLAYYTKSYYDGECTIESPQIVCSTCFMEKRTEAQAIIRGGDEKADYIPLTSIASQSFAQLAQLCGLKGRKLNILHLHKWQKKIKWLHYACQPPKSNS